MKRNMRFLIFGVILACIAALGFSHGAWAGSLKDGTVPNCPTTLTGNDPLTLCDATADSLAESITVTQVNLADEGPVPGSLNFGPGVDLETNGNLVILCFPDIDTPPVGDIWFWKGTNWVYWPTYHTPDGMTCTLTGLSGIYTIEY